MCSTCTEPRRRTTSSGGIGPRDAGPARAVGPVASGAARRRCCVAHGWISSSRRRLVSCQDKYFVGRQGQEFIELGACGSSRTNILPRPFEVPGCRTARHRFRRRSPGQLLLQRAHAKPLDRDGLAITGMRTVVAPTARSGRGDLGGGGIFHQVIERHAALPAQPGLQVLDADTDVVAQALLGDRPVRDTAAGRPPSPHTSSRLTLRSGSGRS